MTLIPVSAAGHHYDVLVGPLADAVSRLSTMSRGKPLALVTEPRVWGLYGEQVRSLISVEPILVPEGEAAKDWTSLAAVIDRLAALNIDRDTPIVAFGGGAVGDLTGLAAGLFKRGCPVVQIPTTLLAQADSAIGGKTAIDAAGEKNLVGMFNQPSLVIADPGMLETLDPKQLRAGYAEVVKYGLIGDPEFFAWCEANGAALLDGDLGLRQFAVEKCIRSKAHYVESDLTDRSGMRALLNLGHSFGHAIEAEAGIGELLHGEAVAIGMCLAHAFSAHLGLAPADDTQRVVAHLAAAGLPTTLAEAGLGGQGQRLIGPITHDKKADASGIVLILTRGIGQAFVAKGVDEAALSQFLRDAG